MLQLGFFFVSKFSSNSFSFPFSSTFLFYFSLLLSTSSSSHYSSSLYFIPTHPSPAPDYLVLPQILASSVFPLRFFFYTLSSFFFRFSSICRSLFFSSLSLLSTFLFLAISSYKKSLLTSSLPSSEMKTGSASSENLKCLFHIVACLHPATIHCRH